MMHRYFVKAEFLAVNSPRQHDNSKSSRENIGFKEGKGE
jgi:hypothetical protein